MVPIQLRPDVRRDGMTPTGEFDTLSRRYVSNSALLQSDRAPYIIVFLLRFNLHVAPKLVAVSAVKEIRVANPKDSDTNN
jgi:hypothetical protein